MKFQTKCVIIFIQDCTVDNVSVSSDIHLRKISEELPQPLVANISLKMAYLKFYSNLPGASELTFCLLWCVMKYKCLYIQLCGIRYACIMESH